MTTNVYKTYKGLIKNIDFIKRSHHISNNSKINTSPSGPSPQIRSHLAQQNSTVSLIVAPRLISLKQSKQITELPGGVITPPSEKNARRDSKQNNAQQQTPGPIHSQLRSAIKQHQRIALTLLKDCSLHRLCGDGSLPLLQYQHRIPRHAMSANPQRYLSLP